MSTENEVVTTLSAAMRERLPGLSGCRVGLVLGSGLGGLVDELQDAEAVDYVDLEGLPRPSVPGHAGRLVTGSLDGQQVAMLQGRVHLYEGHAPAVVVRGVRALIRSGVEFIVLTNAAGAIDPAFAIGDLVLVRDHINLTGRNPLTGPLQPELGQRFCDLTDLYSTKLRLAIRRAARRQGIPIGEAVYAAMLGPSYETPAEIRMLALAGAGLVGMSTVPEAIASRAMGAHVVALSFVTNVAAGLSSAALSHDEVAEAATAAGDDLGRALRVVIRTLNRRPRET
jgi:purine-nucleoside phosphorylase